MSVSSENSSEVELSGEEYEDLVFVGISSFSE